MTALGPSLQLLIWVLSVLRVHMLRCVAINGVPLYQPGFGEFSSGNLIPNSSPGGACLSKWILWRDPTRSWFVSSSQTLLHASLGTGIGWMLFSGKAVSFSSLLDSPRWSHVLFSRDCGWATPPPSRMDQPSILQRKSSLDHPISTRWSWNFLSIY
jgi:hypothetical protein